MAASLRKTLVVVIVLTGTLTLSGSFYFFGSSIYIHAKAHVAQILLHKAWNKTLINHKKNRPWPSADYYPFAELNVPYTKKMIVLSVATDQALAFGPSFHEQSIYPGEKGRSFIAFHRDTHGRFLKKLKEGDLINLKTKEGNSFLYRVNALTILDSSKINLHVNTPEHELILYTCYPFDAVRAGGPMRYVVQAILINQQKGVIYAQNRKHNSISNKTYR